MNDLRKLSIAGLFQLFPLLLFFIATEARGELAKPNIVFILSDNQSYYEMSCHGHAQIQTPHIDRFAKESVEFTKFYAPPFCSPSRSVILTGQYAMRSGVFTTIGGRSIMHRNQSTLADTLKAKGYDTAIFGKWHLGFSFPHRPEDRGFNEVFVHGGGGVGQMEDYFGNTHYDTTFQHNGKVTPGKGFSTDILFDRAMAYVEAHREDPFFCFLSTPVTHSPHHGPKDLVAEMKAAGMKGDLGLFAQVQNLDMNIGRMLKKLDELDLSKRTIVIYASDQGMNDRGAPAGGNRLGIAFDPAQHVPFFVRMPGAAPGQRTHLAGMIDFFPTILDLCGIESRKKMDGLSLKSIILGEEAGTKFPPDRTLIIQCPRGRKAVKWLNASVKTGQWRLVDGAKLFDAVRDPRQTTDVAANHPKVVAQLRQRYEAYWADLPEQSKTLSRHLLGSPKCPEVVLNGMDWYDGGRPWASSHFAKPGNGKWAVTILESGKYSFECRTFPREADQALGKTTARIQIGKVTKEVVLRETAKSVNFELELKAGDYDLQTWLGDDSKPIGALFVYVARLDSPEN